MTPSNAIYFLFVLALILAMFYVYFTAANWVYQWLADKWYTRAERKRKKNQTPLDD